MQMGSWLFQFNHILHGEIKLGGWVLLPSSYAYHHFCCRQKKRHHERKHLGWSSLNLSENETKFEQEEKHLDVLTSGGFPPNNIFDAKYYLYYLYYLYYVILKWEAWSRRTKTRKQSLQLQEADQYWTCCSTSLTNICSLYRVEFVIIALFKFVLL